MYRQVFRLLVITFFSPTYILAQYNISGTFVDETDNASLIGVVVQLQHTTDTSVRRGAVTDYEGHFTIPGLPAGRYELTARYVGFSNYSRTITVDGNISLGTIRLAVAATELENVTVVGQQIRATQSGDTTSFNAGAFKTNPDASAEDLINKMPGITTSGGTVQAQGENVQQVLVDGKPFFGDDPNAALKNLPAEIIDRIQVFDRLSDQAQLTGFDDGQAQKTINIITRPGMNTGQFGRVTGGIGFSDLNQRGALYAIGGNVNFFDGDRRISLIGLSNNVNQQNFSTEDLLGVVNSSSGQNRGGGRAGGSRGGGSRGGGGRTDGGSRGGGGRGGNAGNFLVGQQEGITTTHSVGLNYSDTWGEKVEVTGSYFFNATENENQTDLTRTYFTGPDSNLVYKESGSTNTRNINHRANLRVEYEIDSANTIIFTPRLSIQQNEFSRAISGNSKLPDSSLINSTENRNTSDNFGYNFSGNLVYRHRFAKRGRTLSLNLNGQMNNRSGDGSLYSANQYLEDSSQTYLNTLLDQRYDLESQGNTVSGNLMFTEPLTEKSQLAVNYSPSFSSNSSEKITRRRDGNEYSDIDPVLSNQFENTYTTHRGGLSYRFNDQKLMYNLGLNYQQAQLDGTQVYPFDTRVERKFANVLPSAMLNYRFTRTQNLRLMYRTGTNAPSINQLQNVIDVTNPLFIRTGNPDLAQDYQHTLILRYGNTNTAKSTSFFAMLYGSMVQDYIGNATYIPLRDSVIAEGIILNRGAQLSRPVNLDGYYSVRSFLTYGMPLAKLRSNLNLNLGANLNRLPALINNVTNYANNYSLSGGAVLSSNISENVDFTLSYTGNYNIVRNTIQTAADNNYYFQNTSAVLNWILKDRIVFNTNLNHSLYTGLSEGFNQSFLLWNASLGYKFLKDRSLDVRVTAFDILNQNRAIEREVTDTYIEDSFTNVLRRYFMLNVTYTLRRFGGGGSTQ